VLERRLRPRLGPLGLVRAERRPLRALAELRRLRSGTTQFSSRSRRTAASRGERRLAVADDITNGLDKQSITADPFDSNFVYAAWDRFVSPPGFPPSDLGRFHAAAFVQQAFFSRSTNGGASWEPPQVLYNPGTQAGTIGSIINVLPDRTLVDGFVVFASHKRDIRGQFIADVRSTDLGVTWSKKATLIAPIDPSFPGPTDPDHPNLIIRGGELPDFAVDRVSGKLYVVWDDDLPDGLDKVFFSQSADGGLTWSDPVKINKTPTNVPTLDQQAFTATVKVAADGTVGVTYYDFRNNTSAPGLTTDYWFVHCHATCTDPANWAETHVAGPFDEEQAAFARGVLPRGLRGDGHDRQRLRALLRPGRESRGEQPERRLLLDADA
jgi:hypothetical protein